MDKPLVSVVIPAYNAAKYIEEAVWSVEKQSYSEIEIIVVDDASTDETKNILWDLERHISHKLVVWQIQRNQGAGNALRLGFEVAKGDYVCWLSADDMFVDKDKTRRQVKVMQETNADWSYYPQFQMGATVTYSKKVIGHHIPHVSFLDNKIERDNGLLFLSLLFHNPVNGSTTMFKRETITDFGTFDATLKRADADGDLWLRYTLLDAKVARVPGASILYRTHPEQLSRDTETMFYGTEVTRCRALKSIEDTTYCFDAMIDTNKWLLYAMFILKQYKKRPFVSWMLCKYILEHSTDFSYTFILFCKIVFKRAGVYIQNNFSWFEFDENLERAMDSEEYKNHLERFAKK